MLDVRATKVNTPSTKTDKAGREINHITTGMMMTNKYNASSAFDIKACEEENFGRKVSVVISGNVRRWSVVNATYDHEPCRSCDGTGKTEDIDVIDGACQTCSGNKGSGKTILTLEIDHLFPPMDDV